MSANNYYDRQHPQQDDIPFTPILFIGFLLMALEGAVISLTHTTWLIGLVGTFAIATIIYGVRDYRRNN